MKRGSKEYWACLRKEIKWTAVDASGKEYGFPRKPIVRIATWHTAEADTCFGIAGLDVEDRNAVPWKDSLLKRPHEWQVPDADTPIDTKVWVWSRETRWVKRHFAAVVNGKFFAWANGGTSWNADHQIQWEYAVLADPDNPDREPPKDYVPGN